MNKIILIRTVYDFNTCNPKAKEALNDLIDNKRGKIKLTINKIADIELITISKKLYKKYKFLFHAAGFTTEITE